MKLTRAQQRQVWNYRKKGYTAFIIDDQGRIVPAYSDWMLEYVLDELEIYAASTRDI